MNVDYHIRLINFPNGKAHEMITENEDGSYTIFIDTALSYEEQRKSYTHAVRHIERSDFLKNDVQSVEFESHKREGATA